MIMTVTRQQIRLLSTVILFSGLGSLLPAGSALALDLVSAVLPTSRSVLVGQPATAFASMINVSGRTLQNCRLQLGTQIPATFTYQTTNPSTNALTGSPNTPVTLTNGQLQTFVFAVTPQQAVDPVQLEILFTCDGAESPSLTPNLNMLLFSATATQSADVIALVSTVGNTGIVDIHGTGGVGAFAVAAANVGATRQLRVYPDTSGVPFPPSLTICQTAASGACLAPPGPSVTLNVAAGSTPSFGVFLTGQLTQDIAFDPAFNRIALTFAEGEVVRGATSVAVRTVNGVKPPPPGPIPDETISSGTLTVTGGSTTTFNALATVVKLTMVGATLLPSASGVTAFNNGTAVPSSKVSISGNQILLNGVLQTGKNRLEILALDKRRSPTAADFTLWAGGNQSVVTVRNALGTAQAGVRVRYALSDDPSVFGEAVTNGSGQVTLVNLPDFSIELRAVSSDNTLVGYATIRGSETTASVIVTTMNTPSSVDNNAFTQGLAGWDVGTAPVVLVPHPDSSTAVIPDMDLEIRTHGEGPQKVTRTFTALPGESFLRVKYKFVTTEVPGGYCGTKFNDRFSVTVRRLPGGLPPAQVPVVRSASMNQLGCSAFDKDGATQWFEENVLAQPGDVLQFEFVVVNVGDGAYDSKLVIDGLFGGRFAIETMELRDIDDDKDFGLQLLSVDTQIPGTYEGEGSTLVHGTIRLRGIPGDTVNDVFMEVIQDGKLVAIATLDPATAPQLVNKKFPDTGIVEIAQSGPLFRLPSSAAGGVNTQINGTLVLRVRASTVEAFAESTKEHKKPVTILNRYKLSNRYGERNEKEGGDDWATPSVRDALGQLAGSILVGDISNMNGGKLRSNGARFHKQHKLGIDADVKLSGIIPGGTPAAQAQALLGIVNGPLGSQIRAIGFEFPRVPSCALVPTADDARGCFPDTCAIQPAFSDALQAAAAVGVPIGKIQDWCAHDTHIHLYFTE